MWPIHPRVSSPDANIRLKRQAANEAAAVIGRNYSPRPPNARRNSSILVAFLRRRAWQAGPKKRGVRGGGEKGGERRSAGNLSLRDVERMIAGGFVHCPSSRVLKMRRVRDARLPNPVVWNGGSEGSGRIQHLKTRGGGDFTGGRSCDVADLTHGSGGNIDIGLMANVKNIDVAPATSVDDSKALPGACDGDSVAGGRESKEEMELVPSLFPHRHDADEIARECGPPHLQQDQPGQESTGDNVSGTSSRSAVGDQHSTLSPGSTVQSADMSGEPSSPCNRIDIAFRKERDYHQADGLSV